MSNATLILPAAKHSSDSSNLLRKASADKKRRRSQSTRKKIKDDLDGTKALSERKDKISKKRTIVEERSPILANEVAVHLVGDLVWAKIPGHPWWPSMVAYDPNSAEYFQCGVKSQNSAITKYHVQFFGDDPLRGWVSKGHILNFLGKDEFIQQLKSVASPKESIPGESSSRYAAWTLAVEQAEKALPLTRQDRKLAYVFNYQKGLSSSTSSAKKSKAAAAPANVVMSNVCKDSASLVDHALSSVECHIGSQPAIPDNVDRSENDSGIEDIVSSDHPDALSQAAVEAMPANCPESQGESDMEGPSPKRQRKQKIYEGFHAGVDFDKAFKNRKRTSSLNKTLLSKFDTGLKDPSALVQGVQEQVEILKTEVSELDKLKDSPDMAIVRSTASEKPVRKSKLVNNQRPYPNSSGSSLVDSEVVSDVYERAIVGVKAEVSGSTSSFTESLPAPKKVRKQSAFPSKKLGKHTKLKKGTPSSAVCFSQKSKQEKDASSTADSLDEDGNGDSLWKHKKGLIVCALCEVPSTAENLISCAGNCFNSFHLDCIGINKIPKKEFLCDECLTGRHSCLICKDFSTPPKRCSAPNCGKYYHLDCIANLYNDIERKDLEGKFSCPLHICRYCTNADDENIQTGSGKLLKCIKCPTAYHSKTCVAAGCARITMHHMICDKHCEPDRSSKHINVNWCFVCSQGGTLMCCDLCPASYHPECTDGFASVSESAWLCDNCKLGRKPRYGDIVWVKFGVYRWWPAKIFYPEEVPERIQKLSHTFGDFPVLFFGSRDYCWLRSSRCFNYQEGDRGGSSKCSATLEKYFKKALEEARDAYRELQQTRQELADLIVKRKSNKPPPFSKIKQNKALTCVRSILDPSEWPLCECSAKQPCNSDSECLNRMLLFECNSKTCKAGDLCQNQRMQKQMFVQAEPFKCDERGWGLRTLQDIKAGEFVIEYVGELIDEETCEKRIKQYHDRHIQDYYFLTIDKDNIIDAYPRGNLSRFMNHSCDPNCITQKWTVNGEVRVGLFANRSISAGEELCFNYNLDCRGNEKKPCKCGSKNCSGWIGVPPKTQHAMSVAEKAAERKQKDKLKRKKKMEKIKKERVVHEDDCFLCGDGGELIMCQRGKCPKAYHVACLKVEGKPRGKWECPWHFCDECGKKSTSLCLLCTNSFCDAHNEGEMIIMEDEGVQICIDHEEDEIRELFLMMEKKKEAAARAAESESDTAECSGASTPAESSVDGNVPAKKQRKSKEAKPKKDSKNIPGKLVRGKGKSLSKKKSLEESSSRQDVDAKKSAPLDKKERKKTPAKVAGRKKAAEKSGTTKTAKKTKLGVLPAGGQKKVKALPKTVQ